MTYTKRSAVASRRLGPFVLALALASTTSSSQLAQAAERPADVLGLAFIGHHVSDLEKSIEFFEAIDFEVAEGPSAWTVDDELNRLGNTPGAETRTAVLRVQSSVSDVPFELVLRQYRGIERQDWSKLDSWDLHSAHIDMTIEGSVSPLLDELEAKDMLVMPEVRGLPNERTTPEDFRRFAFIQDPDGLVIEYFGKSATPPAQPLVSNSTATPANIDRWGKQAGFNHYAINVIDPETAQDFYVKVLGGDYPELEGRRGENAQIMMHGWFPQTTDENLRLELIYFSVNEGKSPPPVKFQDINANHAGFQVSNIETAYARAKEHGAITVSQGGIVDFHGDKAVLIRDPDVGGYIVLWQPAR